MFAISGNGVSVSMSEGVLKVEGEKNLLIEIDQKVDEADYLALCDALYLIVGDKQPDFRLMAIDAFWEAYNCVNSES